MWKTPVTDRTASDAEKALEYWSRGFSNLTSAEQAEFLAGMKGSLNWRDINRIQNNIQIMSDQLSLGLTVSAVPEFPNESLFAEILSNVGAIQAVYKAGTVPAAPVNTYTKVNQIEDILQQTRSILLNSYIYSGDGSYAGNYFT